MKSEYKIFAGVSVFLFAAAVLYSAWAHGETGHVEWVGAVALVLAGLLCAMCGGFFWFVARRIDLRPEDRADGEISEGAGEIGFFSPGSYWPFGLAASAAVAALGLVYWTWWLLLFGLLAVVFAASGLLFEYYSGTRRMAE